MQLSQAEITQQSKQKYLISGTVDFSTVSYLMQRFISLFQAHKQSASVQSAAEKNAATITTLLFSIAITSSVVYHQIIINIISFKIEILSHKLLIYYFLMYSFSRNLFLQFYFKLRLLILFLQEQHFYQRIFFFVFLRLLRLV